MYRELRHYQGNTSVPEDGLASLDKTKPIHTCSEYNPIAVSDAFISEDLSTNPVVMVIHKDVYNSEPHDDIKLGYAFDVIGGYHSEEFNCNGGFRLDKEALLYLVSILKDSDELVITSPNNYDYKRFTEDIMKGK